MREDLIERLNEAWRKLYGDGDEHGVCDTLAEAAAALEAAREDGWLPIESAPKDGRKILLFCLGVGPIRGCWDVDRYAARPRPYWTNDFERIRGIRETRADQPTHWRPLPAPPAIDQARGKGGGEVGP